MELTHVNSAGNAFMVDVSSKEVVRRTASAYGKILLQKETIDLVKANMMKKGDVLGGGQNCRDYGGKKNGGAYSVMPLPESGARGYQF